MSQGLTRVSTSTLQRLRAALESEQLRAPLTGDALIGFHIHEQLDALVRLLAGHSRLACLAILEAVLAERDHFDRPPPELVWTGPEAFRASARDTAVVLRELFERAQSRVVLAGYSFRNARDVIGPLHTAMKARGVESYFFVDVPQTDTPLADPEGHAQKALDTFIAQNWPFGAPYPALYCDRRALQPGPPWCSLHSKCVAVDGQRAFVSSANFTERGQERNIEAGVLLHDPTFASHLERQWLSLMEENLVLRWKGPPRD